MSALSDLADYLADRIPEVRNASDGRGRVYSLLARQDEPTPYIVYQQDSDEPGYELSGEAGYSEMSASYAVWSLAKELGGGGMEECEAVSDALRLALTGVVDMTLGDTQIDVVLADGGEADSIQILDGEPTGKVSKTQRFFIRYFRTVATAPGV